LLRLRNVKTETESLNLDEKKLSQTLEDIWKMLEDLWLRKLLIT